MGLFESEYYYCWDYFNLCITNNLKLSQALLYFPGNLPKLRSELQRIFGLIRHHPPALTYRRVCHALAWINMHLNDPGNSYKTLCCLVKLAVVDLGGMKGGVISEDYLQQSGHFKVLILIESHFALDMSPITTILDRRQSCDLTALFQST